MYTRPDIIHGVMCFEKAWAVKLGGFLFSSFSNTDSDSVPVQVKPKYTQQWWRSLLKHSPELLLYLSGY